MTILAEELGVAAGEDWLFRELDLVVGEGECAVLTGPNGAGKSTLLRCLYGSQAPTEGTVTVCGTPPDERSPAFRRRVSVLLDDSALFDELTPRQHLDLLLRSFPGVEVQADPGRLLAFAGLDHRIDVPAGQLSAGQRRRLLLLGCVARPHEVLLLDEPERALDAEGREWLADLITESTRAGAAVVAASHFRPLVDQVADSIVDFT
ncbi:ABC transporter ATP-binding protein [Amycolatopsis anabasis]|uniref:ABC transporter ATP-binding protein n=1 Tax=Amycolatopsis anabasis TaxID=1840409 RepID=UPI00131AB483|nr:ABC transporter ATP-binding protein [Amycolatopsis anabasis]